MHFQDIENPTIKVFGVGGGGTNAIGHIIKREFSGAELYCLNTDSQSLKSVGGCKPENLVQLGKESTKGLGAGAKPEVGRLAAEESIEDIRRIVEGADMIFIAAGMGGGTGTGAAPVVAKVAKELGVLTVAVVTKPFNFEGKRMQIALDGIKELTEHVDSIVVIPNQKLIDKLDPKMTYMQALEAVNEVLHTAVSGISDLILKDGLVNVDFADVSTVMGSKGLAIMGTGRGIGEDRAVDAVLQATSSPLLDDIDIHNAEGLIVSIVSGMDLQIEELGIIGQELSKLTADEATIKVGNTFDLDMHEEIQVTVIATGLRNKEDEIKSKPVSPFRAESEKVVQPQATQTAIPKKDAPKPTALTVPSFLARQSA